MKIKILILSVLSSGLCFAQQQNTAAALLERAAAKIRQTPNFAIDFSLSGSAGGNDFASGGKIFFMGGKYYIKSDMVERMYDGKKAYNIMAADKEVVIEENPSPLLYGGNNFYDILKYFQRNYNIKTDIKQPIGRGRTVQYLKFEPKKQNGAPLNMEDADRSHILVGIVQETDIIHKIIDVDKNEKAITFEIISFSPDALKDGSLFVFDEAMWKSRGYYIVK